MRNDLVWALGLCFCISLSYSANAANYSWDQLCAGDRTSGIQQKSTDRPVPNYENPLVRQAAAKLTQVQQKEVAQRLIDNAEEDKEIFKRDTVNGKRIQYNASQAFYPYTDFEDVYGLCAKGEKYAGTCKKSPEKPKAVGYEAHNFLTILCGEYRDRPSMVQRKMEWAANLNIVEPGEQTYDPKKGVWEQISGEGYKNLVFLSNAVYEARKRALVRKNPRRKRHIISGMTICEYRYMLSEYLSGDRLGGLRYNDDGDMIIMSKKQLEKYEDGLEEFEKDCSKEDLAYFYEFRGDGNLKAQSMESNGMIWSSRAFSSQCASLSRAAKNSTAVDDDQCQEYFSNPYTSRNRFNTAGLLRLLFYPDDVDGIPVGKIMNDYGEQGSDAKNPLGGDETSGSMVFMTEDISGPDHKPDGVGELVVLDPKFVKKECKLYPNRVLKPWKITDKVPGACRILNYREYLSASPIRQIRLAMEEKDIKWQDPEVQKTVLELDDDEVAEWEEEWDISRDTEDVLELVDEDLLKEKLGIDPKRLVSWALKSKYEKEMVDLITLASATTIRETESAAYNKVLDTVAKSLPEGIDTSGIRLITEVADGWNPKMAPERLVLESGHNPATDFGFKAVFGKYSQARKRITTVLDRHTDWYLIDYLNLKAGFYKGAFSPWLASSHTLDRSHQFTIPGYAQGLELDPGRMHWMYIQKVPVDHWIHIGKTTKSKWPKQPVDFFSTWWDETTFSTSGLGESENGWDRFGMAVESEIDSMLWLYFLDYFEPPEH